MKKVTFLASLIAVLSYMLFAASPAQAHPGYQGIGLEDQDDCDGDECRLLHEDDDDCDDDEAAHCDDDCDEDDAERVAFDHCDDDGCDEGDDDDCDGEGDAEYGLSR